jgi:hypothetical protein
MSTAAHCCVQWVERARRTDGRAKLLIHPLFAYPDESREALAGILVGFDLFSGVREAMLSLPEDA